MDYSMDTPFESYQEIQKAVKSGKATLSHNRVTAFNIACDVKPLCAIANLIIPFISIILMWIVCAWLGVTKWILLFGIVTLPVSVLFSNRLNGILWVISITAIVVPLLLLLEDIYWLVVIGVGIIGMMIGDYIWWGLIASVASVALMSDESLFEATWTARQVALRTAQGFHIYSLKDMKDMFGY